MPADAIDNGDDESYLNLDFFLPDAPTVDVAITTRYARAAEMTTLDGIEVREMETAEAVELFRKCAKLQSPGVDMKNGNTPDRNGIREARAGDHAGGTLCCGGATGKVGHPLISAGVSLTMDTGTGHEDKEGSPNPAPTRFLLLRGS
jgi:hypothetical protein